MDLDSVPDFTNPASLSADSSRIQHPHSAAMCKFSGFGTLLNVNLIFSDYLGLNIYQAQCFLAPFILTVIHYL